MLKIKIGRSTYHQCTTKVLEPPTLVGRVFYGARTILQATHAGRPLRKRSDRQMKETLWHECTHAILKDMGSPKESDEKFVTELAKRIQQVGAQIGY